MRSLAKLANQMPVETMSRTGRSAIVQSTRAPSAQEPASAAPARDSNAAATGTLIATGSDARSASAQAANVVPWVTTVAQ